MIDLRPKAESSGMVEFTELSNSVWRNLRTNEHGEEHGAAAWQRSTQTRLG